MVMTRCSECPSRGRPAGQKVRGKVIKKENRNQVVLSTTFAKTKCKDCISEGYPHQEVRNENMQEICRLLGVGVDAALSEASINIELLRPTAHCSSHLISFTKGSS